MAFKYKCPQCGHEQDAKVRCTQCGSFNLVENVGGGSINSYAGNMKSSSPINSTTSYGKKTKEYKVVPGPKNIVVVGKNYDSAFNQFSEIINRNAVDGWEYYSMETLSITQMQGCLNTTPLVTHSYMLIFVKDLSSGK